LRRILTARKAVQLASLAAEHAPHVTGPGIDLDYQVSAPPANVIPRFAATCAAE
jgi:hypothetical protein